MSNFDKIGASGEAPCSSTLLALSNGGALQCAVGLCIGKESYNRKMEI